MFIDVRDRYKMYSLLFLIAAALMSVLLLRMPPSLLRYLLLATPYAFLLGLWVVFRGVSQKFRVIEAHLSKDAVVVFNRLKDSIYTLTLLALAGIAIALAIGFTMGRLGMGSGY